MIKQSSSSVSGWCPASRLAGRKASLSVTCDEGTALPADDVLAQLGSGTLGLPGDEAARRLRVVANQLWTPLRMLLAVTVMAVVDQIEITG